MKKEWNKIDWETIHDNVVMDLHTMHLQAVADKYGLKYSTLLDYCQRNNIKRHVHKQREKPIPKEKYGDIRRLYEAGENQEFIAKLYNVSIRAVNCVINNIYMSAGRSTCWWLDRVHANEFRRSFGHYLDKVLGNGALIIQSHKRGEMVIMTGTQYDKLYSDAKAYRALQEKEKSRN